VQVEKFLNTIKENNVQFVSFRFSDIQGKFHQITWSADQITCEIIDSGVSFDGSSIEGWKEIHNSDTIIRPDLKTVFIDPFTALPTMNVICDVIDPETGEEYSRDPRSIAKKAEKYLGRSGLGDIAYFGPEMEFFVFDNVIFENSPNRVFYEFDSEEGPYNNGRLYEIGNLSHRPDYKAGYFPVQPVDSLFDIRSEMCRILNSIGLNVTLHHHEVAASQSEIGFSYGTLADSADNIQKFKYVVRNVAASYAKTVTFMPKPVLGDNGSGMHTHQSIWKGNKNLFFNSGQYADMSEVCLYYIGGIIKHAKALNAFTNPSTNSYKRLIPGYEAPVNLAYSKNNRSAAIRIPYSSSTNSNAKRIEARFPDPLANPYLSFAALLMAGLDGIKNKIHPGEPVDKNLFSSDNREEISKIGRVSRSLREALDSLNEDRNFLLEGGVFTDDFIDNFINIKLNEVIAYEIAPHPVEYKMYYSG
jgi:glutamine synthetase